MFRLIGKQVAPLRQVKPQYGGNEVHSPGHVNEDLGQVEGQQIGTNLSWSALQWDAVPSLRLDGLPIRGAVHQHDKDAVGFR
jgi:hypothetical protein